MKKTSFFNSLPFKLLVAVILGIIAGLILNRYSTNGISMAVLNITVTIKYILGQLITFCVPLIVIGFIAPSITKLGHNASRMLVVALVLAYCSSVGAALVSMYRSRTTQSFAVTLAILPAVVQLVIMLVNGDLGAGVAVAGAFSLVRFRSAPGTAREIGALFLAMALGLATGMGYVWLAVLAFAVLAAVMLLLTAVNFGSPKASERVLKITIPENLDYEGLFDDLFPQYTSSHTLTRVKTSNMGTLYELEYHITLPGETVPKAFLDDLRCRNGNLNITCGREAMKDTL